jgi:ribose transport system substrate-binding protein
MAGPLQRGLLVGMIVTAGIAPMLRAGEPLVMAQDRTGTPTAIGGDGLVAPAMSVDTLPPAVKETKGPNGEAATSYLDVRLSADELKQVQQGSHSAALVMHTSSAFIRALEQGATDAFAQMGVEVIARTDAGMDPAKQQSDAETVMARHPDIVLTLPIDPVQAAEAFRPAVEAGTKLVLLSNVPKGYEQGKDYVGVVTDDLFGIGQAAAEMLGDATGGTGEVGFIYHDADFYVTNQRDQAFKTVVQKQFPNLKIVAEQGMADPKDAESIAAAMLTRNPGITAFYVPWAEPAENVLSALRAAGRDDVKVVTIDLDTTVALDMAQSGNIVGIAADTPYLLGYTIAIEGAYGVLGKQAPPFVIVPTIKVTKDNLAEGWQASLHEDAPPEIVKEL